jgi:3-oxoacyl-[acyl-carrier-protein] synthase-3
MDDRPVCLLAFGGYVPERVMSNEEWSAWVDTSDEWITSRTGIERRRFAAEGETTASLAVAAARSALAQAGLGARDLDEIIVTTDTPEVRTPDTAAFVQHLLGAREIPAYDLAGSGCAGFLQGLDVARSRVLSGAGRVMVVGVELLSRTIDWHDRNTAVLFGDGAGAVIVGHGEGKKGREAEIAGVVAGTDGSRTDILGIEVGGSRHPFTLEAAQERRHLHITMHGREVFREAVRRMGEASRQVLAKAGLTPGDVDLLIPHQANLRILQALAKSLGLPPERVFVNVQEYGNTGSASVPLALWEAQQSDRIRPGDRVLLTSFGAGFHWAAVLLRF